MKKILSPSEIKNLNNDELAAYRVSLEEYKSKIDSRKNNLKKMMPSNIIEKVSSPIKNISKNVEEISSYAASGKFIDDGLKYIFSGVKNKIYNYIDPTDKINEQLKQLETIGRSQSRGDEEREIKKITSESMDIISESIHKNISNINNDNTTLIKINDNLKQIDDNITDLKKSLIDNQDTEIKNVQTTTSDVISKNINETNNNEKTQGLIGSIMSTLFGLLGGPAVIKLIKSFFNNSIDFIKSPIKFISNLVTDKINAVKSWAIDLLNKIPGVNIPKPDVKKVSTPVKDNVLAKNNEISKSMSFWDKTKSFVSSKIESTKEKVVSGVRYIKNTPISEIVSDAYNALSEKAKKICSFAVSSIKNVASSIVDSVKSAASTIYEGIKNLSSKLVSKLIGPIKQKIHSVLGSSKLGRIILYIFSDQALLGKIMARIAKIAASAGSKIIPGAGFAIGAYMAWDYFKRGRWILGIIAAVSALVSLIPGIGGVIACCLDICVGLVDLFTSEDDILKINEEQKNYLNKLEAEKQDNADNNEVPKWVDIGEDGKTRLFKNKMGDYEIYKLNENNEWYKDETIASAEVRKNISMYGGIEDLNISRADIEKADAIRIDIDKRNYIKSNPDGGASNKVMSYKDFKNESAQESKNIVNLMNNKSPEGLGTDNPIENGNNDTKNAISQNAMSSSIGEIKYVAPSGTDPKTSGITLNKTDIKASGIPNHLRYLIMADGKYGVPIEKEIEAARKVVPQLSNLHNNIIEPLRKVYGDGLIVTSGFRSQLRQDGMVKSGQFKTIARVSDHAAGDAADIYTGNSTGFVNNLMSKNVDNISDLWTYRISSTANHVTTKVKAGFKLDSSTGKGWNIAGTGGNKSNADSIPSESLNVAAAKPAISVEKNSFASKISLNSDTPKDNSQIASNESQDEITTSEINKNEIASMAITKKNTMQSDAKETDLFSIFYFS